MPSFHHQIKNAITQESVAKIAKTLDEASIPAVLWGDCMLDALGIPTPLKNIAFIVPDEKLDDAVIALHCSRFTRCCWSDEEVCTRWDVSQPLADVHFHMLPHYPQAGLTIELYRKSSLLWTFPSLPRSMGASTSKYLMYVADERLPPCRPACGNSRYGADLYPVKIPRPEKLIEALLLLHRRDLHHSTWIDPWIQWLGWIKEYVVDTRLVPLDEMAERFCPLWQEVLEGTNKSFYERLDNLGEMGHPPSTDQKP